MSEHMENVVRATMRLFEVSCPSCGSDEMITVESEGNTDVGIMDEMYCGVCEASFKMISSVHTFFVINQDEGI